MQRSCRGGSRTPIDREACSLGLVTTWAKVAVRPKGMMVVGICDVGVSSRHNTSACSCCLTKEASHGSEIYSCRPAVV